MNDAENSTGSALIVGRPFLPGQSGNPGGRPRDALTRELRRRLHETNLGVELLDELANIAMGKKRVPASVRLQAIIYMIDRAEGKARQALDVSSDDGSRFAAAMAQVAAAIERAPERKGWGDDDEDEEVERDATWPRQLGGSAHFALQNGRRTFDKARTISGEEAEA